MTHAEHTGHPGSFWVSTEPGEVRDGTLMLRRGGRTELRVEPELYSWLDSQTEVAPDGSTKTTISPAKDRGPQTLHGLLHRDDNDPLHVSLMEAHAVRWNGSAQTFEPIWTLLGGHITQTEPFTGVRVRIPGFTAPDRGPVPLPWGGQVAVADDWIELAGVPPHSYRELERTVVRPLSTLLTLAAGQPVRPGAVEVSPEPGTRWPVHAGSHVAGNAPARSALVPSSDLTVARLAQWLDRSQTLGPLPAGVASVFENDLAVDTQVLLLTTLTEGVHRVLHPKTLRFSAKHGDQVRTVAVEAVRAVDPDAVDAVKGFLSFVHEVGYARRLEDLARRAEELVPGITGNTNKWVKMVYKTRTVYAHHPSAHWMEEADLDRVLTVVESLRWMLRLLLLDQAGLDPHLLASRFAGSQRYNFFLTNAANWRPDIYASPSVQA
jgi:hypothetical protein